MNLISNALKFTNSNGRIIIKIYKKNDCQNFTFFEINDTGSGMTSETIKKLGNEY